jgi:hypothetical protein
MRKLAAVLVFSFALGVEAQTITSISPSSVQVNSGELFITVNGTNLGNRLVFDGPAGHHERNVSATSPAASSDGCRKRSCSAAARTRST